MSNMETKINLARKQVKLYRDALALCPNVMEVVRKFNGKVANKRLETALKDIDKGIVCRRDSIINVWEIKFYTSDRFITAKETSWNGNEYNATYYITESEAYFARDMFGNTFGKFTDDDGRWIAENICKQIEHTMKSLEANIAEYEDIIAHVDELEAEKKRISAEVESHNRKIGWFGNKYFDLKV